MTTQHAIPSARESELLEAAYRYVLEHGLANLSLRPLASAIGSSPRVLLYLFGSKDGLTRALLARARVAELDLLDRVQHRDRRNGCDDHGASLGAEQRTDLVVIAEQVWSWLVAEEHRALLTLWIEGYARSLLQTDGPWAGFARSTVEDWLAVLAAFQPAGQRETATAQTERTLVLAVLRGALLDLLATGDAERTTTAVHRQLSTLRGGAASALDASGRTAAAHGGA